MRLTKGLIDRLALALQRDHKITAIRGQEHLAEGVSTAYMQALGLSKIDLKRLESNGFALRGYTKNVWLEGETLPNGKLVAAGKRFHGRGHAVRWLLLTDAPADSGAGGGGRGVGEDRPGLGALETEAAA